MAENRMEFSIVATDKGATAKLREVAKATGGVTAASKTATPALLLTKNAFAELTAKLDPTESSLVRVGASLLHVKRSWTKVALMAGGLGVAALAAGAAFLIWQKRTEAIKKRQDELAKTLDKTTGAVTDQTREVMAARLIDQGAAAAATKYGLSLDLVAEAALGSESAQRALYEQIMALNIGDRERVNLLGKVVGQTQSLSADTKVAALTTRDLAHMEEALNEAAPTATRNLKAQADAAALVAEKHKAAADAVKGYQDALKATTDPVFALLDAMQGVNKAQGEYAKAVAESGAGSNEAQVAAMDLAKAQVELNAATNDTALTIEGGRQAILDMGRAGGMTAEQLALVAAGIDQTKAATAGLRDPNITNAGVTQPSVESQRNRLILQNSGNSSQLAAALGGSKGAGSMVMPKLATVPVNLRVSADANAWSRLIMQSLRVEIAKAGGNVQKAVGKR